MPEAAAKKIESVFHNTIWGAANEWKRCERALVEARDLCRVVVAHGEAPDLTVALPRHWMENFGA